MQLFDKKAERTVWIGIIATVPVVILVLWLTTGEIGTFEIGVCILTFLMGLACLYFVKWYANKK